MNPTFESLPSRRQDMTDSDRTVVVVAHANTIRSLMAALDEVPDEDVPNLHVPNSVRMQPASARICPHMPASARISSHLLADASTRRQVPILYRFERSTSSLISSPLQSAAGGSHARWLLSPENHEQIKEALKPGVSGSPTRWP